MSDPLYAERDEKLILGAILAEGHDAAEQVMPIYRQSAFFNEAIDRVLAVVATLEGSMEPVTLDSIRREWPKTHQSLPLPVQVLVEGQDTYPGPGSLGGAILSVYEAFQRRTQRQAGLKLAQAALEPHVSPEVALSEFEKDLVAQTSGMTRSREGKKVAMDFLDDLIARQKRNGQLSGITTGFRYWDILTDGFQPTELALIAARPSIGKTALATSCIAACCHGGQIPTLLVTAEMNENAIQRRLMSNIAGVPMNVLKSGRLTDDQTKRLTVAMAKCRTTPFYILNAINGMNCEQICGEVRRMVRKHGIRMVFVDYLQKIKPAKSHEKRTYEVGDVCSQFKAVADSCKVTVVGLAQLSREAEKDKDRQPRLSDLADSSQLEKDADQVILINRQRSEMVGPAQLMLAKQRDGELGVIECWYDGTYCRFEDVREKPEMEDELSP